MSLLYHTLSGYDNSGLRNSVEFCIAVPKILSLEYKPVGLVSHSFHSLFACRIPLTYK